MTDLEKSQSKMERENNPAFNTNYNKNKTETQLNEIRIKKIETNKKNKEKHMNKNGTEVIIDGVLYSSINEASKHLRYSFKYIKRRVLSKDYENFNFKEVCRQ